MVDHNEEVMDRCDDYDYIDEEKEDRYVEKELNRFRRVLPTANENRGRPIPLILHDRSIRGRGGIGGLRNGKSSASASREKIPIQPSPSSVIPSGDMTDDTDEPIPLNVYLPNGEGKSGRVKDRPKPKCLKTRNVDVTNTTNGLKNNRDKNNDRSTSPKARLRLNAFPTNHTNEIRNYAEHYSVTKFEWSYLNLNKNNIPQNNSLPRRIRNVTNIPDSAISTISIAFSPDGRTVASTHGDHTVKITCCHTGKLVRRLEGHARTPWTVKYHPSRSNIVASGCLGFQVRIWDWNHRSSTSIRKGSANNTDERDDPYDYELGEGICINMIRLQYAIISLSFHPSGVILAIASGTCLHLWDFEDAAGNQTRTWAEILENARSAGTTSNGSGMNELPGSSHDGFIDGVMTRFSNGRNTLIGARRSDNIMNRNAEDPVQPSTSARSPRRDASVIEFGHALRCVHFPPGGDTIIVGGVNPPQPDVNVGSDERGRSTNRGGMSGGGTSFSLRLLDFDLDAALYSNLNFVGLEGRRAVSNSRIFVGRALLYNDGGFDVSPDGKTLCACAEYWLPYGVNSAMELLDENHNDDGNHNQNDDTSLDNGSQIKDKNEETKVDGEDCLPSSLREVVSSEIEGCQGLEKYTINCRENAASTSTTENEQISPERSSQTSGTNTTGNDPVIPSVHPTSNECKTPPTSGQTGLPMAPPSPPGRKPAKVTCGDAPLQPSRVRNRLPQHHHNSNNSSGGPPPPPLPQPSNNPFMLTMDANKSSKFGYANGRYVPHVVTVSLDSISSNNITRLGQLLEASPLDGTKASGVTCVKFSPSAQYCLLGYGVREHGRHPRSGEANGAHPEPYHPVTALYSIRGGMTHVATMLSKDDDVNIARFHPESGHGFVYGTKQGRVRVLSPRPWNHYN